MEKISHIVDQRLLPGIHGLRGLAATCVVLYHIVHLVKIYPPEYFGFITTDFGYSVHLFFILSAYSLMHSTLHKTNEPNWLNHYFIKRFFRIAPLFYVLLLLMALIQHPDLNKLILNFTFAFGLSPRTGIVWGGWSVGVEMLFYATFPVIVLLVNNTKKSLILCLLTIITSSLVREDLHLIYKEIGSVYDWSYFSFGPNFCFFCFGIFAFHFRREFARFSNYLTTSVTVLSTTILAVFLFTDIDKYLINIYRTDMIVWGVGLAMLTVWQANKPSIAFNNKIMWYLGERSYSIYLLHPIIILYLKEKIATMYTSLQSYFGESAFFICAIYVLALLLIIAEFTYRYIEIPGINLGKRIIHHNHLK